MKIEWENTEIFIRPGVTDMRKQMKSLAVLVNDEMGCNPLSGSLYVFCGKSRKILKALYWDRNGFCLWQKRLEENTYPWPRTGDEAKKITEAQLWMLLDGIDFFRAHKKLIFSEVS